MPALDIPQHGLKARHAEKWARKFSPVLPETPLSTILSARRAAVIFCRRRRLTLEVWMEVALPRDSGLHPPNLHSRCRRHQGLENDRKFSALDPPLASRPRDVRLRCDRCARPRGRPRTSGSGRGVGHSLSPLPSFAGEAARAARARAPNDKRMAHGVYGIEIRVVVLQHVFASTR
jgi:hypothetical protein